MRGVPFTLGGNVNWVPGYTTRLDVGQTTTVSTKQVWDVFALWTINPATGLRLLANNIDPREYTTSNANDSVNVLSNANERTTTSSYGPSYLNWQLRLELKL